MEENLQQSVNPQPIQPDPVIQPLIVPSKPKSFLTYLLAIIIIASISVGAFYLYNLIKVTKTELSTSSSPSEESVTPSIDDRFANWIAYSNQKMGISFKLPKSWTNYSINDFSPISITGSEDSYYLGPENSSQKPPQIIQITSYLASKYVEQQVYPANNCTITDIAVGLEKIIAKHKICKGMESNGFITVMHNQYIFIIDELKGTDEDHENFNRIISSIIFTEANNSENILNIIQTLTSPMVWTSPVEGTIINASGEEVSGTIISSIVATKEENRLAGLLVTDTPLVKEYGWAEDLSGIANGMGESISTYTKNNQTLIIRYKGGEYKVLLSK